MQMTEYDQLAELDRALILEALVTIVANTELLRNHLLHLEPEGATLVLNRGAIVGQDSAGNMYHQLGGPGARWVPFTCRHVLLQGSLHCQHQFGGVWPDASGYTWLASKTQLANN